MAHYRVTALWNGAAGLPGYTRIRIAGTGGQNESGAAAARLKTFFDSIASLIPASVTISYTGPSQQFDASGLLTNEYAYTAPANTVGTGAGQFAAPAGMHVNWLTGNIFLGRRVRGRTFLVPLAAVAFSTDGTPAAAAVTQISSAATALVNGGPAMVILARRDISGGPPAAPSYAYSEAQVTGSSVPDKAAVLRSRRP